MAEMSEADRSCTEPVNRHSRSEHRGSWPHVVCRFPPGGTPWSALNHGHPGCCAVLGSDGVAFFQRRRSRLWYALGFLPEHDGVAPVGPGVRQAEHARVLVLPEEADDGGQRVRRPRVREKPAVVPLGDVPNGFLAGEAVRGCRHVARVGAGQGRCPVQGLCHVSLVRAFLAVAHDHENRSRDQDRDNGHHEGGETPWGRHRDTALPRHGAVTGHGRHSSRARSHAACPRSTRPRRSG